MKYISRIYTPIASKKYFLAALSMSLLIVFAGANILNPSKTYAALTDKQIEQRAEKYCDAKWLLRSYINVCKKGFIAGAKGQNEPQDCKNGSDACKGGYKQGKKVKEADDNSTGPVPKRAECDDTTKPNECKKEYDECNNLQGPRIQPSIDRCKRDVLDKYPKKAGGGGGGGGAGGGGGGGGAAAPVEQSKPIELGKTGQFQCGNLSDDSANFKTKLNFGCLGTRGPNGLGPIQDLVFAIIRFASIGVGILVVLSIIAAGIQYSTAEGNAEATQKSKKRIQQTVIGLVIYIFAFSILQFLVPGGLFRPALWLIQPVLFYKFGVIP